MRQTIIALVLCVLVPAAVAADGAIVGHVRVIDGDTLDIAGERVRLAGMDAFERDQACGALACGAAATASLGVLVKGGVVTCSPRGRSYNRAVAVCRVKGRDIGALLVTEGLALNDPHYPPDYAALEATARAAKTGAWAHEFDSPRVFRALSGLP